MSEFRPPPPRKGPPGPPPRPQAAPLLSDPDKTPVNPFLVGPANHHPEAARPTPTPPTLPVQNAPRPPVRNPLGGPTPAAPAASNPFMDPAPDARLASPLGSQPQVAAQVAPRPASNAQATAAPPVVGRPGAESPQIKDPHAEFRKGNTLKRLLLVAGAAAVIGGIIFLSSGEEPKKPVAKSAETKSAGPVIGSSVSPQIIKDPNDEPLSMKKKAPVAEPEEAPPSAPKAAQNDGFANAFKSSAK